MKSKLFEKCNHCDCIIEMKEGVITDACSWCGATLTHNSMVNIYDDQMLIRELLEDKDELHAIGVEKINITGIVGISVLCLIPLLVQAFTSMSGWILTTLSIMGGAGFVILMVFGVILDRLDAKKITASVITEVQKADYSLFVISSRVAELRNHIAEKYDNKAAGDDDEEDEDLCRETLAALEKLVDYILIKGKIE